MLQHPIIMTTVNVVYKESMDWVTLRVGGAYVIVLKCRNSFGKIVHFILVCKYKRNKTYITYYGIYVISLDSEQS